MKKHLLTLALIGLSAVASNAAILVQYGFPHASNSPTDLTATTVAANMTATAVGNTVGISDATSNVLRISDGTPVIAPAAYVNTAGDMVSFRIDANAGYYFDLTSSSSPLTQFKIGRISGATTLYSQMQIWGASGTTATVGSTLLYTSAEASATSSSLVTMSDTAGIAAINGTNQYTSLFIQVQRRASASGTSNYSYDDFRIDGAVLAVPEPASSALIAVGMGLAAISRRRVKMH